MSTWPELFWGQQGGDFDTFERLGLIRREWGSDTVISPEFEGELPIGYKLVFTRYAINFLAACHGPLPLKR